MNNKLSVFKEIVISILILTMFSVLVFSGCKQGEEVENGSGAEEEPGEEEPGNGNGTEEPGEGPGSGDEDIINAFNELLDEGAKSYQLISFIDENATEISPEGFDILLEKLEMVQKEDIQYYTDLLLFEDDWQNRLAAIFQGDIGSED